MECQLIGDLLKQLFSKLLEQTSINFSFSSKTKDVHKIKLNDNS